MAFADFINSLKQTVSDNTPLENYFSFLKPKPLDDMGILAQLDTANRDRILANVDQKPMEQYNPQPSIPASTPFPQGYSKQLMANSQAQMQQDKQSNIRHFTSAAGNQYQIPVNHEYDRADIKGLIKKYFPRDQWDNAMKVAQAESGGQWWKIGDDYPIEGQIIPSHGIFQIRAYPDRPGRDEMFNPEKNVAYAAQMYKQQGWQPWTTAREMGLM